MKWERFKSFLLIILTVSSLSLTGIYMLRTTGEIDETASKIIDIPSVNIELSEIIHPQGLFINFGGDSHTAFFFEINDIWKEIYKVIYDNMSKATVQLADDNIWRTVLQERSIHISMENEISAEYFFGGKADDDIMVDEICIPLLGRDFILLKSGDQYYKVAAVFDNTLETIVSKIESSGYVEFKTIEKRFSIQNILSTNGIIAKKNMTIIPISEIREIPFYKSEFLVNILDVASVENYVQKIFGANLSFIKKMTDYDGTVIYLTNYGKKTLSFGENGSLEYINNMISENHTAKEYSFADDLQTAWEFISYFEENNKDLFLSDYKKIGNVSYFYFNARINSYNIYYGGKNNGNAVEIRIKNNEINYYYSNRRTNFEIFDVGMFWDKAESFSKIFDTNFELISQNYQTDFNIDEINEMRLYILQIVNDIEAFDFVYFIDASAKSNNVIPAWRIKIGPRCYYFDIYEGILLEDIKEKANGLEKN
ncbi:MAG: hypothetical protein JW702_09535 [Clostridiales bacterium]|nr:hypothetical protein [Clostridiales bacterium]